MKKAIFTLLLLTGVVASAEIVQYQATSQNTPCVGYAGQLLCVQACSTTTNGTATVSAVTDLLVNGSVVSFTNVLATVSLTNGVGQTVPTDTYVAPKQRIIVSGNAFPGGSAIVWLKK